MQLITWSIQWGRRAGSRVSLDLIEAYVQRSADFDVFCVQEVSASHRRRFCKMLFSHLSVRPVFRYVLPWPAEDGVMSMQRVAVGATLDTLLGLLRVTTTHLEYYSERQRAAQIDRLRELHGEAVAHARVVRPGTASDGAFEPTPRTAAAVPGGDFNFKPDDPDHARLLAPMDPATLAYCDALELTHAGHPREPTVGAHDKEQWPGPHFTFDFNCAGADIARCVRDVWGDETNDASDHQPMLLELA